MQSHHGRYLSEKLSVPEKIGSQAEPQHWYLNKGISCSRWAPRAVPFLTELLVPPSPGAGAVPTLPAADEAQAVKPTARPQSSPGSCSSGLTSDHSCTVISVYETSFQRSRITHWGNNKQQCNQMWEGDHFITWTRLHYSPFPWQELINAG